MGYQGRSKLRWGVRDARRPVTAPLVSLAWYRGRRSLGTYPRHAIVVTVTTVEPRVTTVEPRQVIERRCVITQSRGQLLYFIGGRGRPSGLGALVSSSPCWMVASEIGVLQI